MKDYLIVHKSILPDYYSRVISTRNMIESQGMSVTDACKKNRISRSTFYKYKDFVFVPSGNFGKKCIFEANLKDSPGVLAHVMEYLAEINGNIVTINQTPPLNGWATSVITLDMIHCKVTTTELVKSIKAISGVIDCSIIALE